MLSVKRKADGIYFLWELNGKQVYFEGHDSVYSKRGRACRSLIRNSKKHGENYDSLRTLIQNGNLCLYKINLRCNTVTMDSTDLVLKNFDSKKVRHDAQV